MTTDQHAPSDAEVAVIGAGVAGLSAALTLGRACRRVVLYDHGPPRNAAVAHAHGLLTRDGASPTELRRIGLEELAAYDVDVRRAEVVSVERAGDHFEIESTDHSKGGPTRAGPRRAGAPSATRGSMAVRAVILATGVLDVLPEIPGLAALWGDRVVHCPYCDGWERRNQPLAVLGHGHEMVGLALLLYQWSRDVRLVTNGEPLNDEDRGRLASRDLSASTASVREIVREGDRVVMRLDGGGRKEEVVVHSIFAHAAQRQRSTLPASLGCALQKEPDSHLLKVSEWGETSVPGVYAVGDMTTLSQQISFGIAAGAAAAVHLNHALIAGVPAESTV
ncbi:MAG TPA: NAD(P)/FAD-dependent oxidoreductase [Gemmatimonadaceae bacterium]|nr:NAD(P)/FAD-dependent oxidoreductase [Gemmatimonadaceae bacterium]